LLRADGSGWFGGVDLVPGEYLLSVQLTLPAAVIEVPLSIAAGSVTDQQIALPPCATETVYLPLIVR
jgi:hypothetical protein